MKRRFKAGREHVTRDKFQQANNVHGFFLRKSIANPMDWHHVSYLYSFCIYFIPINDYPFDSHANH